MRKIVIIVVTFLFINLSIGRVFAQDAQSNSMKSDVSYVSNYTLSYPGVLPDNPLYFLKAARDRITAFFISDPMKKANFDLLQSDKRVEASYILSQKGKGELAESTFSKAENYFEDAINRTHDAKTQGVNTTDFAKKLIDANQKYKQVLEDEKKNLNKKEKEKLKVERDRLYAFDKKVKELAK